MKSAFRKILMVLALSTFIPFYGQDERRMPIGESLAEERFFKLQLDLPSNLLVSGHQVTFPSGKTVTFSILETIALNEHQQHQWSLTELANVLDNPAEHIRCAALVILVRETKEPENHSTFLMSVEELKRGGIISKWKSIAKSKEGAKQ